MTTRTTPSPIEIIADPDFRGAAEAGSLVVALDAELTTVLLADEEGGRLFATSEATLRQIRSTARTLAETGRARLSLRRSTRVGTQVLDASLTLRPETGAGPSFALLSIAGLGRPANDGALLARLFRSGEQAAVFAGGLQTSATDAFDGSTVPDLGVRIERFEAGSQAMFHEEQDGVVLTLARAPFGRIVALIGGIAPRTDDLRQPEASEPVADGPEPVSPAPGAGFSTFSVKRSKLGEARPGMSMGALLQRWHSRGPETDLPRSAAPIVPDRDLVETPEAEAPGPAATREAVAAPTQAATAMTQPASRARQRSNWGQAETTSPAGTAPQTAAEPSAAAADTAAAPDMPDVSTIDGALGAPDWQVGQEEHADAIPSRIDDEVGEIEMQPTQAVDRPDGEDAVVDEALQGGGETGASVDQEPPPASAMAAVGETETPRVSAFVPRFDLAPVRFVWQIDRDGAFRFLSPDFANAVGPNAADVVGRSFATVSHVFGFDETREIARLLERRDTWSGRTIFWPVEGSDRKVPVDLAALPVYGRDRSFDGFRGFGIVRLNESVEDEEALGLHLTQGPAPIRDIRPDAPSDAAETPAPEMRRERPFLRRFEAEGFGRRAEPPMTAASEPPMTAASEPPVTAASEPPVTAASGADEDTDRTQKVIRLEERRRPRDSALSTAEEAAFRAIGAKLGHKAEAESPGALRFEEPAPTIQEAGTENAASSAPIADGTQSPAEEAPTASMVAEPGDPIVLPSEPNAIEPALEALSEKLDRAEAEADRRLEARRTSSAAQPASEAGATPLGLESSAPEATLAEATAPASDADADVGERITGDISLAAPTSTPAAEALVEETETAEEPAGDVLESAFEEPVTGVPSADALDASPVAFEASSVDKAPGDDPDEDESEPPLDLSIFERLFAGLPLAVLVQVHEHTVYVNAEFALLTGHGDAEAVEAAGGLDTLVLDRQGEGTLALLRADGEIVEVHGHMQRIAEGGRSALLMSFQRVVDEDMAAGPALEDLRKEVEELQAVLDTATDGVVLLDASGNIRAMNGSAHALFGIGADEAFGRHLSSLFAHESQKSTVDYLEMLRDDGIGGILNDGREVIGRVSKGGLIPLFITIGRLTGERGWCVVIRDIAHWKRIEEDLVNARRQAEAASLHKSRFLANISHELRTPLNAIIGFADVMSSECFGPIGNERYLEYLGDIKRSGHHVLDLVNDLLDISKIEAGKIDLSFEAVSLNEVISEAVSLMQPQANRERVIVRSNLPSSVPPVVADRRTVRQIALNLLANAIRFTPAGGQIIASTTYSAEGDVLLRFRDSGIGMTEREIELALTPFQQVHAPSANRGEGTGLGLPLTKAMVEANRAYFSIQSSPGEGTLVEIVFPAPRVLAD